MKNVYFCALKLKGMEGQNCVKFGPHSFLMNPNNVYNILWISVNVNNYFGLFKTHSFTNSINNTHSGKGSIDQSPKCFHR